MLMYRHELINKVSIPYRKVRYGSKYYEVLIDEVSIPYRKVRYLGMKKFIDLKCGFQSLIGRFGTIGRKHAELCSVGFNPL